MSKIAVTPNVSGTGTITLSSPNTDQNRTVTMPDATGAMLLDSSNLNAAKLTGALPAISGAALTGISTEPFKYTAVTGTTPSLNVGTFNFFDSGTLTANTTVSFASVPTNANWRYSCVTPNLNVWDISVAVYSKVLSVSNQGRPHALSFKPDGTSMYILSDDWNTVYQFDLSTAWEITSSSLIGGTSITAQDASPRGMFFRPDGLKMYMCGVNSTVYEYNLGTAWDISSLVFLQEKAVNGQETKPLGVTFKPDGTKMYIAGDTQNSVLEYNLSTAWNVTTAVYLQSFSVATQESGPNDVIFNTTGNAGTTMFIMGDSSKSVLEYTLSTAYDITSAVYYRALNVTANANAPTGIFISPTGNRMYFSDFGKNAVYQYNIGVATAVTLPAAVVGTPSATSDGDRVTYEFFTKDGGTTVNLIGEDKIQ